MVQDTLAETNDAAPLEHKDKRLPDDFQLGVEGFTYGDLYRPARLRALAGAFYAEVESADPALQASLAEYVAVRGENVRGTKAESDLLIAAAPHLSRFVARLFRIEREREDLLEAVGAQDPIFQFQQFVQRRAVKSFPAERAAAVDAAAADEALELLRRAAFADTLAFDRELGVARVAVRLLEWEKNYPKARARQDTAWSEERARQTEAARAGVLGTEAERALAAWRDDDGDSDENRVFVRGALRLLEAWAAAHALRPDARERVRGWVSFRTPRPLNYEHLVQIERPDAELPELMRGLDKNLRRRDGFKLTDKRYTRREVLEEVNYCLYCHERDKDSCSKGLRERDGSFKKNPLGILLEGCPLDEKISEMHVLQKAGDSIGALALIVIDNPMCPGTGHRICNDCMKSCIFQKQEPVNIPQAETGVLTNVLSLPYGFEIYSLLTRWNPLNARRPYALGYNGKNVLVVGLGPAGYTLAHFLLNEGFGVVGIDGLKIEPLNEELTGDGGRVVPRAVRDVREIETELDRRVLAGFGGVSEYGITVRWDKNFLTLMHLTLARRDHFRFYGGVRFGGTLTIEDAWRLGFDHIAVASGAGKPTLVEMKNNLSRGIRKASDFLMALQLTGAAKRDSFANLQVRLPALVIGGGLTAIDTATELFAYYPVQVEKTLERFEKLAAEFGDEEIFKRFDAEERGVLEEYLAHGRAIRAERERAARAGEAPDFVPLVRAWGGVTICYRKRLIDSPAYRLNHEEIIKSLEEGISIIENLSPAEAIADEHGAVAALLFNRMTRDPATGKWHVNCDDVVRVPARTVCVAAGTSPNTIYERERPGTFALDEWREFFSPHKVERGVEGQFRLVPAAKGERAFFTSYENEGRFITYYGDNHPVYAGNVVKAMASAKDGYGHVAALFADEVAGLRDEDGPAREGSFTRLVETLDENLIARVERVERLTDTIVEVVVRAPMQARKFHPGQFYRLQNYETDAAVVEDTRLTMEGLALTGAWVDKEAGLLSLIVLEMGASSRQCVLLRPGQQVVVMGPTGTPTEIPEGETVLLAGGGLGNAVLFSIAKAMRERGNRVIYFAGYKDGKDLFKREEIEAATDQVIWSTDTGAEVTPRRPQDAHFRGNIVQAMKSYAEGSFGPPLFDLREVERIIAIGSDRMMAAVKQARHTVLDSYLNPAHVGVGSINSPMQCMMKEVCAQCLQRHVNPQTGEESFVFSCFNQDQLLDEVDFQNLNARLRANTVQEKLANLWLDHLLREATAQAAPQ
ncbi:MAG TPA: FAD-dependent oxidoreductase [Pyrinomonadaceae bacterium]|jgi:NADPH-dependent glutamate synthase beta subunit-like oxidoreductase/NAD(P)H-flavin reductase|nr:FAD-dependent oxidoreductase [Pyrinomonadaceae bacterium]